MWGFLGSIGSSIGKGAKFLGGGIKSGFNKLNEMGGQAGGDGAASGGILPQLKRPMPMTPGFNPDAPMPSVGGGKSEMFAKGMDLINRQQPQPNALPPLQRPGASAVDPLRESVDVSANLPMGRAEASPLAGQMIPTREIKPVRPPDFLGRPGATLDDTPINHDRYQYQTQYMQDGKIPRRWQDILATTLHGAAQGMQQTGDLGGALGGAISGGAGSAISPLHAREFRFNQEQLPRLMANRDDAWKMQDRDFEMQKRSADLEGQRARTAATIAGTKDAELEREYRQAQIDKIAAQEEAIRLGKDVVKVIPNPETGELEEVRFFADGTQQVLGKSGTAILKREGVEAQNQRTDRQIQGRKDVAGQNAKAAMERVRVQQSGATGRTAMTQAGQNQRQKERLGASGGGIPPIGSVPYGPPTGNGEGSARRQGIIQLAIDAGLTLEQAKAEADKRGIK
jgi:hypothetical protein